MFYIDIYYPEKIEVSGNAGDLFCWHNFHDSMGRLNSWEHWDSHTGLRANRGERKHTVLPKHILSTVFVSGIICVFFSLYIIYIKSYHLMP